MPRSLAQTHTSVRPTLQAISYVPESISGLSQGGLDYICATAERFFAVSAVLNNMVQVLPENPSVRLLKHVIRCYLRLSDNARAREALRQCLPPLLMDLSFTACLKEDMQTRG